VCGKDGGGYYTRLNACGGNDGERNGERALTNTRNVLNRDDSFHKYVSMRKKGIL
jgi:hypothetical protein